MTAVHQQLHEEMSCNGWYVYGKMEDFICNASKNHHSSLEVRKHEAFKLLSEDFHFFFSLCLNQKSLENVNTSSFI